MGDQDEPENERRGDGPSEDAGARERAGLSDFVRRAVSAGFDAATRSKEDIVRVAAGEIRSWLDHLELDTELRKALARMVVEVKAEIRFRPSEDGKLEIEARTDTKVTPGPGAGGPGPAGAAPTPSGE